MSERDDFNSRLARLEANLAIQQLPSRYALAVDSRNIDMLVELFSQDVDCGKRWGKGRNALKAFYANTLATSFYRSQHFICGHVFDLIDTDSATGSTYCQAFHEDGDGWYIMAICYLDHYVCDDGKWLFSKRQELHWHAVDALERPNDELNLTRWPRISDPRFAEQLPKHWPSWNQFWQNVDPEIIRNLTKTP